MTDDELIAEMAEKAGPEWMRRLDMDDVMRAALAVARPVIEREALEKAVAACNEIADGPDQFNGSCRGAIRTAAKRIKAIAGGTSQT